MKILLLFLICFISRVGAEEAGPESSYVQDLMQMHDFTERWNPNLWEEYSPARRDPNGGYIFRYKLNWDANSSPIVFMGSDRFGNSKGNTIAWDVYMESPDQSWKKIASSLLLRVDQIYLDHSDQSIIQRYPERLGDGESFRVITIDSDGEISNKLYRYDDLGSSQLQNFKEKGVEIQPEITKIPIAAYLSDSSIKWHPYDFKFSTTAQSMDPSDKDLLSVCSDLGKSEAFKLTDVLKKRGGVSRKHFLGTRKVNLSPGERKHSNNEGLPEGKATASPTNWPYYLAGILLMVLLGGFVLLKKK